MLAEPLPVAWRVRVIQPSGVIHHERVFGLFQSPSAEKEARRFAHTMAANHPSCRVEIAPLTPEAS